MRDTDQYALGFDHTLLANGVTRRFVCALYEWAGRSVPVLSSTASELTAALQQSTEEHWRAFLLKEDPKTEQSWDTILTSAAAAAEEWLEICLETPGELLQPQPYCGHPGDKPPSAINWHAELQRMNFPFEWNPGAGAHRSQIIECLENDIRPVIPAYCSVSHDALNEWVSETFKRSGDPGQPADIILEPEEAIAKITNRNSERIYHAAIAIGLPPTPRPDPVTMDGILRRTVDALFDAGLPRTGATVLFRYENDPDPVATYARVATNLPVKTRTAEERRLALTKQRVIAVLNSPATAERPKQRPSGGSGRFRAEDLMPTIGYPKTLAAERERRDLIIEAAIAANCGITREAAETWLDDTPDDRQLPEFPAQRYREERLERERQIRSETR